MDVRRDKILTILAKFTVVCTGGVGNLYHTTTNPSVATGDGIAMVHRAKGVIENMQYIQFHPTTLYNPTERPAFLITEAMRGYGAILKLQNGKELSERYMSPVDFVKRVIFPIFKSNTPANMVNHDAFRQEKNYDASTILAQKILSTYVNKLHGFVDYYKETPYNRMLKWGALFAALNEVLIADALTYKYETEIKEIDATEFEKLPKRYRGAFKKCQYNPNRYIYEQKNYTRVIRVIHNTKPPNYKLLNAYV